MHIFEMVAIIVVFSLIAGVINNAIKVKANASLALDSDTVKRIDQMEERIEVLERVITDDRHSLKSEIDKL